MEVTTVTSYFYTEDQVNPCRGEASLEYLRDDAQETAEYLIANKGQLGPQCYLEALKRVSMSTWATDEELSANGLCYTEVDTQIQSSSINAGPRQLDEKITYAIANMDYPQQWRNTDSHLIEEGNETGSENEAHELCRLSFARGNFVPVCACNKCFLTVICLCSSNIGKFSNH